MLRCLRFRFPTLLLALLLVTLPLGWTLGGNTAIKIINHTDYYLHVFIDGDSFLYIPPTHGVGKDYESHTVVANVRVLYAPGQAVSGSVTREMSASAITTTELDCGDEWWCRSDTRTVPGHASWTVVPSDFVDSPEEP